MHTCAAATADSAPAAGPPLLSDRSCPLNHRAAHRSYPQLWRSKSSPPRNRPVWPSDRGQHRELQACKLPTVWITVVDNYPAGRLTGSHHGPEPAGSERAQGHRGRRGRRHSTAQHSTGAHAHAHGTLWKTGRDCGKPGEGPRGGTAGRRRGKSTANATGQERWDRDAQPGEVLRCPRVGKALGLRRWRPGGRRQRLRGRAPAPGRRPAAGLDADRGACTPGRRHTGRR